MRKLLWFLTLFTASAFAQSAPTNTLTFDFQPADVTTYGVTSFVVQRKLEPCSGTGAFSPLGSMSAAGSTVSRTYSDPAVTVGKTYAYRVYAAAPKTLINPQGDSGFSACAEKTIPLPAMPVPQNLIVNLVTALIDALTQFKTALQAQ